MLILIYEEVEPVHAEFILRGRTALNYASRVRRVLLCPRTALRSAQSRLRTSTVVRSYWKNELKCVYLGVFFRIVVAFPLAYEWRDVD